jgi:FkbM family methyltransferase
MTKYYSQYGEDVILARLFPGGSGTCIEVGANDGVMFSNSYHFEQIGWRCILIEPTPTLCAAIRKVRNSTLFECAASDIEGEAVLHIAGGAELYSSLEANSTMADTISRNGVAISDVAVKTRRLDDMLVESNVTEIDFISIDVEGHEISVLKGFSIQQWKPRIVIIEDATDLMDTPVSRFMSEHEYVRFYRAGGNDWYASPAESRHRSLIKLLLSRKWRGVGLIKAWLPAYIRRPVISALRFMRA